MAKTNQRSKLKMDKEIASFLVQKFYEKDFKKYEKDLAKATKNKNEQQVAMIESEFNGVRQKAMAELNPWLENASARSNQLSLTSHSPKFSHPDAKIDAVISKCHKENDGLLRSGNVEVGLDVMGNAASFDVDKFLRLKLHNNLTVLENLEQNTDYIQQQFKIDNFTEIRENFLKIHKPNPTANSSGKLKQIYFPVNDDYHLLSLLTPSPIVYKLKQKINENLQPFSVKNKQTKEEIERAVKDKKEFTTKLENIWDLTAIGYGGTKPQNISVINNQNSGFSYLLPSMPPILTKRKTQPPKENFFKTNIYLGDWLKGDFNALKKGLSKNNNIKVRSKRDEVIINIAYQIKREIDKIREIGGDWSNSNIYSKLPKWQKILLDNQYQNIRDDKEQNADFLNKTRLEFSKWFSKVYNQLFATNLGDIEITHIEDVLKDEMEVFK
jgi:CRISPR-associated protein Csy1